MKTLKFLLVGAVALMALAGCKKEKDGNAQAYITLSEEELLVSSCGRTVSVSVQSNYDWEFSYSDSWFKVEKYKGNLNITYDTNETGADRKGTVSVTAGDGGKNVAEAELKITQSWENYDALILEYTITANSTKIELPVYSVSDAIIDWGDGDTETTSENNPSHRYTIPGVYTVTVNGTIKRLFSGRYSNNGGYNSSSRVTGAEYLTAVIQWGDTGLTNMAHAFFRCSNLASLPDGAGPFSSVSDFSYAFYECSSLTAVPENIFSNCTKVTNFSYAFRYCSSLTAVPENIFSNCTKVTNFSYAFYSCSSLTAVPENIFSNCTEVTDFSYVFFGCSSLTVDPENMFSNRAEVTDFSYCFYNCKSLTSAPSFEGCSSVTTFNGTLYGCSALTTIPESIFSGCSMVTDFSSCFYGCRGLTTLPSGLFEDCSSVTTFKETFDSCTALTTIPENIFSGCSMVTDFSSCFYGCASVDGESPYTIMKTNGENVKVHLYERSDYAVEMHWAIPEEYSLCFRNSTFSDIDSIPSKWK